MTPEVSIIIPAHNASGYIAETIDSVISQSYNDWELIIVDDGSTDATGTIAKSYVDKDPRIRYVWQQNGRQGKARNLGLSMAKGNYINFIDADDLFLPDAIGTQVGLMEREKVDLVFGYSLIIEGQTRTGRKIGRGNGRLQGDSAIDHLLYHDAFIMSTVLSKKEILLAMGGFPEESTPQYGEDWTLWLKLAFAGYSFYTEEQVVSYTRMIPSQATNTEPRPKEKLFYSLIRVDKAFPGRQKLEKEILRRIHELITHSLHLDQELLATMIWYISKTRNKKAPSIVFRNLMHLNLPVFRKTFLAWLRWNVPI